MCIVVLFARCLVVDDPFCLVFVVVTTLPSVPPVVVRVSPRVVSPCSPPPPLSPPDVLAPDTTMYLPLRTLLIH